jgi:hypothetical protein
VSTALSSTDTGSRTVRSRLDEARRALADTRALFEFRAAGLRGRARRYAAYGVTLILLLTLLAGWLPAYLPATRRVDVFTLLPSALVGVVFITIVSAAASGGGRELIPREQAVGYPITPAVDHLGALIMAPLNIAWLLQAWTLLGATAYVVGPRPGLFWAQLIIAFWLVAATAAAQVVGWTVEWVRRGPYGVWLVRALTAAVGLGLAYLIAANKLIDVLQTSPTVWVTLASLQAAPTLLWFEVVTVVLATAAGAVVLGAWVAGAVVRRPARDQLRLETSSHPPRANPVSDLVAMMRTDRVGIWRSVGLRRGLVVLAVMPGLVAIAGNLQWQMLTILPGLVASGGALLFGVNSWCLDGRGALWRDSLPGSPRMVFLSRLLVLIEVLAVATLATIVMASLRAGIPTATEFAAVACCAAVVVVQVVSASLRWSVRRPFAVDLRSSRATPAPPLVMVGYSSRLALTTTLTGLVFSLSGLAGWGWSVAVAVPMLLFSAYRLVRTSEVWADPLARCHVVATVAS